MYVLLHIFFEILDGMSSPMTSLNVERRELTLYTEQFISSSSLLLTIDVIGVQSPKTYPAFSLKVFESSLYNSLETLFHDIFLFSFSMQSFFFTLRFCTETFFFLFSSTTTKNFFSWTSSFLWLNNKFLVVVLNQLPFLFASPPCLPVCIYP